MILNSNRKLVALLVLSDRCIVTINVLWRFLMVPWVGLQYAVVVFPDHTHLLIVLLFFDLYFFFVMREASCCLFLALETLILLRRPTLAAKNKNTVKRG